MKDFDVVIVGGGINGLTAGCYLAKAGLRVAIFERRGQCGAHCDTVEVGLPDFLHNLCATWLVTATSPAMVDLELEKFGLEFLATDVAFAKTFADGKNVLMAIDPMTTLSSFSRASERDAGTLMKAGMYLAERLDQAIDLQHEFLFTAPKRETLVKMDAFMQGYATALELPIRPDELLNMNGFETGEVMYESEEVRSALAVTSWVGGFQPIHRRVGSFGTLSIASSVGPLLPAHQARGGSHSITHALVKCFVSHGGEIWTTCSVDKILTRDGRAIGIRLSEDALLPGEEISARVVLSDLTVVPTFVRLLGADVIGDGWVSRIKEFVYDEQTLFGVYYALSGDPVFASADWDAGIQRSFIGFFGGETVDDIRRHNAELVSGVISDDIAANWFVPTRADPSQAPPGCHTAILWVDVPPSPRRWRGRRLAGWDAWRELAQPLADAATDAFEQFAPGFRDLIIERHVMTPVDQERNNPSAVRGNSCGGSIRPEQFYLNRPVPGVIVGGASRTFVPGLYLCNSIHPIGASNLASGYMAARDVAEDLEAFDPAKWAAKGYRWYLDHINDIPRNLGVSEKWKS